ncbi:dynein regulatory complex subunit 2-like isoform X2 [Artemia franciscana]|uniref:dynein regulatory complex subunit 2-like isoform X2 n=1 Tax=Artemia franciscana TaxID=6661 RepID=UPI0032DAD0A3
MFSNSATKYGKSESKKSKKTSQNKRSNKVNKYQVEQKAAVEEERRRLREELIQIFLQHKLEREQGLGRANQAKINEKWRKVLRDTKNEQIKEEIEQLREKFNFQIRLRQERILELTDQVILSEKNELDLNQSHIKNLGLLIGFHITKVSLMKDEFTENCSADFKVFEGEQSCVKRCSTLLLNEIKDAINKSSANFEDTQVHWSRDAHNRKEELLDECLIAQHSLSVDMNKEIDDNLNAIKRITDVYQIENKNNIELYDELKFKTDVLEKELSHQESKIGFLTVLDKLVNRGQNLLRMVNHTFPVPLSLLPKNSNFALTSAAYDRNNPKDEVPPGLAQFQKGNLDGFWSEFNKLLIEKTALVMEAKRVEAENSSLKKELEANHLNKTLVSFACTLEERKKRLISVSGRSFSTTQTSSSIVQFRIGPDAFISSNENGSSMGTPRDNI